MQSSDIPAKFPIPFANAAGPGYTRPIPVASQVAITPGAASLTDGFPPLNFIQVSTGGIPPFGEDMNGLLNQVSAWSRWFNAGGPVVHDATFSAAIGGYPKGSMLISDSGLGLWISIVENNITDPDTGGAGWIFLSFISYSGIPIDGIIAVPSSTPSPLSIGGLTFVQVPTLADAASYPLARVTSRINMANLNNTLGSSAAQCLNKVGSTYVISKGGKTGQSTTFIKTATNPAGPWTTSGSIKGIALQNATALVLVDATASQKTTNGTVFAAGTLSTGVWTDGDASPSLFAVIAGGNTNSGGGGGTSYRTSPDGVTWTSRTLPAFNYCGAIAYGAGKWIYVTGQGGTVGSDNVRAYSSPDGIAWTLIGTIAVADFNNDLSLVFCGSRFFLGGDFAPEGGPNHLFTKTSLDGTTWVATTAPNPDAGGAGKQAFAYDGQVYQQASTLYTSTDGITFAYPGIVGNYWTPLSVATTIYHPPGAVVSVEDFYVLSATGLFNDFYTPTGLVGLPYPLPAPTIPAPFDGPTDSYEYFIRIA